MNHSVRFWAAIVAVNAAGAVLANIAFGVITWHTPWPHVFASVSISFLFSFCCASPCVLVLPWLGPIAWRRFGFPFNWAVMIAAMVVLASVGSLTATLVLAAIGYIPPGAVLRSWFGEPLKISVILTLLFGVFVTAIEQLRARLDATTIALRTKERDEAEARRLAAEAQLASIESRVQPHFLFNTLNSIAALIPDDPTGAEHMTGLLATLLRSSLDQQATPLVAVDEEMRIVRSYLEIERMRFGDRLRYEIRVDAAAGGARVPRLVVQTIVENSVKYAVSPRREGASIAVRATAHAHDGHVEIEVRDDGPGFDGAKMVPGHGLALVRDRLAMTLGDRSALRVESAPGRTRVSVSVPANPESRIPNPEAGP